MTQVWNHKTYPTAAHFSCSVQGLIDSSSAVEIGEKLHSAPSFSFGTQFLILLSKLPIPKQFISAPQSFFELHFVPVL